MIDLNKLQKKINNHFENLDESQFNKDWEEIKRKSISRESKEQESKDKRKEILDLHYEYEKYLYLKSVENNIEGEFKRLLNKFGYK